MGLSRISRCARSSYTRECSFWSLEGQARRRRSDSDGMTLAVDLSHRRSVMNYGYGIGGIVLVVIIVLFLMGRL